MKPLYTAIVIAHGGGREGRVRGEDPALDLRMSPPKILGGDGTATNPEQLFAAGYAACFESSLRRAAKLQKRALGDVEIAAHVTLCIDDGGALRIAVELHGKIPGLAGEDALALMQRAHEICPYSNATRGNVEVKLWAQS